jgi:hypothetical protein
MDVDIGGLPPRRLDFTLRRYVGRSQRIRSRLIPYSSRDPSVSDQSAERNRSVFSRALHLLVGYRRSFARNRMGGR